MENRIKKRILFLFSVSLVINIVIGSIYYFSGGSESVTIRKDVIGAKYPDSSSWAEKISQSAIESNDAVAMFLTGLKNFETNAPYAASTQTGRIEGTVFGSKFSNYLSSVRIYQNDIVFWRTATVADQKIAGQDIRVFEETYVKGDKYYYRKDKTNGVSMVDGEIRSNGDNFENKVYENFDVFFKDIKTDPKRLSMHTFTKDTIKVAEAPVYDKNNRVYQYSFSVDLVEGVKEYAKVLEATMDPITGDVNFKKIFMTVVQWENGLIKEIVVEEEYRIAWAVDVDIAMSATTYFSYDKTEPKYQITDYVW